MIIARNSYIMQSVICIIQVIILKICAVKETEPVHRVPRDFQAVWAFQTETNHLLEDYGNHNL